MADGYGSIILVDNSGLQSKYRRSPGERRPAGQPSELLLRPTVPSPAPWRYRNRARWIVNDDGLPCYHQAASDRLLPVRLCHIVQPLIGDVLGYLGDEAWRLPLRTLVAEITARTAVPWTEGNAEQPTPSLLLALHPRPGATSRELRLLAGDLGVATPALDGVVMAPRT